MSFAASALVFTSCSNDELENGELNPAESGKGYISVSFTTNTNSSRAVDDTNNGDQDGDAEDSGHHTYGTEAENKITSVMIIGIGTNPANSFSKYYASVDVSDATGDFSVSGTGTNAIYSTQAIEVSADTYTVNVIVNPSSEIINLSPSQIEAYAFSGGTLAAALEKVIGTSENPAFMMSGKESSTIEVESTNNTADNAATGDAVEVERVVAKIAFRPTTCTKYADGTDCESAPTTPNIYPVKVTFKKGTLNTTTNITTWETVTKTWYVKLEKYALVNLNKKNYAIRHTTADFTDIKIGEGSLEAGEWLVDPFTVNKNAENPAAATFNGSTYFFNSLAEVTTATVSGTDAAVAPYFFGMPDGSNNETGEVSSAHNGINYIGTPLSYCFENAVTTDKQTLGLSTGIAIQAKLYKDADCTAAIEEDLYRYAGNYYTSLTDIENAYKDDAVYGTGKLTGKTDVELEALGIEHFAGGKCYYYTSQIKHFDDGDNTHMGVMEFAIMRNNIYSLAVESIGEIGTSSLTPYTPGTPDEEPKTYIKVSAKILPWIVRFNNIKF